MRDIPYMHALITVRSLGRGEVHKFLGLRQIIMVNILFYKLPVPDLSSVLFITANTLLECTMSIQY